MILASFRRPILYRPKKSAGRKHFAGIAEIVAHIDMHSTKLCAKFADIKSIDFYQVYRHTSVTKRNMHFK